MEDGIRMSSQASKLGLMAVALLLAVACAAGEKSDKPKAKAEPKTPADLFTPTPQQVAKEAAARDYAKEIEAELAARAVPLPPEMDLDLEWYSPFVDAAKWGRLVKGWVGDDLVLIETDKHNLLCVRRVDGVQKWACELSDAIRYSPSVTRNNVVVNVKNFLVAIHREAGYVRWRLLPSFVMSCSPLVIDPPAYPKEYTKEWKGLETMYAGGWDGRFYCMTVRGRMTLFVKNIIKTDNFSAPEFDLFNNWHKTHKDRGVITANIVMKDNLLYYTSDDHNVCCVSREGVEREPYYLLGIPTTGVSVTASTVANVTNSVLSSVYVGARDDYVYCLDRLTLKKKWTYAPGYLATGNIVPDEAATPMAYVPTADGMLHALQLTPARASKGQGQLETPESCAHAWGLSGGMGVITLSPDTVYVGMQREGELNAYKAIAAVDKSTGKVRWQTQNPFFAQFLEFPNAWTNAKLAARVYAITADNRLICLKEKIRDTGLQVVKVPAAEPEAPKMPIKKGAKAGAAEGAAPGGEAAKPAEEPKKEEPKKEEPKKEEPKKEEPKKEEPKKEEPKKEEAKKE